MPSFAAPDGATLAYEVHEPARPPRAAILLVQDWSDHGGRYAAFGESMAREGFATYAADVRGHGRSGGRRGHLTRFSQLLGDLQAFRRSRPRQDQFVREFQRAGGVIVAGSDAANQLLVPGAALHDEMAFLVRAGLTPWKRLPRPRGAGPSSCAPIRSA